MTTRDTPQSDDIRLRQQAEVTLRKQDALSPKNPESLSNEGTRAALHELQVHQIELEMQNEELRRTQSKLATARERYFDLYDMAPVGYCTINEKGIILEANLTAASMLGVSRQEMTESPFSHFVCKEDQETYYLLHKQLFADKGNQAFDLRILNADGSVFWAHLTATAARDADGTLISRVAISDVSDTFNAKLRFESSFRNNPALMAINSIPEMKFLDVNDTFVKTLGYPRDDVIGKSSSELNLFPNAEQQAKLGEQLQREGRIESYELDVRHRNGKLLKGLFSGVLISGEGQQFMLTVMLNITERRKAEDQLQKSEERFREVLENSQDAAYKRDLVSNSYEYLSPVFGKITGYTQEELNNLPIETALELMHPDDLINVKNTLLRAVAGTHGATHTTEYRFKRKDGQYCCIQDSFTVMPNTIGKPAALIGSVSDITARKQAEDALEQTRVNYEMFFNTIDEFLFVLDEQGNIIHTNSTVIKRLGYPEEDLKGKPVLMVHPPDRRDEAGRIVTAMLNGTAEYCPVPLVTNSGIQIPVETRVAHGIWNGKPAIFGISKDISEIKLSEEKFSKVFYLNPSACGLSDLVSGKYVEVNEAFQTLLGFENNEVIGKTPVELGILTIEHITDLTHKITSEGKTANLEADLTAKNGDIKHVLLSAEKITVQDKQYRYTVVHDITERKRAEDTLRDSEERHRTILQTSMDGFLMIDLQGYIRDTNETYCRMSGYSPQELLSMHISDLNKAETQADTAKRIRQLIASGDNRFESRHWQKDGSCFDVEISTQYRATNGGYFITFVHDITARKKALESSQAEHKRIENIIESTNVGTWEWNVMTGETVFNERWAQAIGYSLEELAPVSIKTWEALIHPEDLIKSDELLKKHFAGELPYYDCECRMKHKDGHWVWVHDRGSLITRTVNGQPHMMFGTHTDITVRKGTDQKIIDSEVKYHTLFNNAQVGMVRTRLADSKILDINDKAAEIFGCTREEALGSFSVRFWVDPEERTKATAILKEQGFIKDFENRIIAKNGQPKTCVTSWKLYPETQILEGSIIDITERKRYEEKIQDSLEEKVVLLKEIEHRVKNSMQVMSSLLQLQATYVVDPRDATLFKDSQERIKSMALVYERLYQSPDMAHVNLKKYVTNLVSELRHSYNIGSAIPEVLIEVEDIEAELEAAIPYGLIITEVISNSLKYAFPDGRLGTISVNVKKNDGKIEMSLTDNGIGMPENATPKKPASLGVRLIYILAEHQLGGKVDIERAGGTKYKITIPMKR